MRFPIVLALLSLATAACSKPSPAGSDQSEPPLTTTAGNAATTTQPSTAGAGAKAKEIFASRCTPCHGAQGRGDGAASASLTPPPRNFHDPAWHTSIDDAYIEKIIRYGGTAVGKSAAMPGNPDLTDQTVVAELRSLIRSFNN